MSKFLVHATWSDAPHLSESVKAELYESIPAYQRDARTKGIPQLGSGAIYPIGESEISCAPFEIPAHWPRAFGLDTDAGAGFTACVWGAIDRETQTVYLYDGFKRGRAEIAVYVDAMKSRGPWIPGVGDCAALMVTTHDAIQVMSLYRAAGIDIELPDKSVEAGIQSVWTRLSSGRLKVFASIGGWFEEYRLYRRDDHGRVVKANDHYMDATRYLCHSGLQKAKVKPVVDPWAARMKRDQQTTSGNQWMAR